MCYHELSRQGADAGSLVPLSTLFPIVGVIVDLSLGETISTMTGIGIAIVLISGTEMSREMLAASTTSGAAAAANAASSTTFEMDYEESNLREIGAGVSRGDVEDTTK